MSTLRAPLKDQRNITPPDQWNIPPPDQRNITPPSRILGAPLTPPSTCKKSFPQACRVIALFKDIKAGRHVKQHPWTQFQLAQGEFDEIERCLRQDESLFGFVKDKTRYVVSMQDRDAS